VLRSNNFSLAKLRAEYGEMTAKALLSMIIIETVDFFNVGKTMSDRQIAQTIDLILEDYFEYKPDFFVLCFNRAKKGAYGKSFDRIDGQIIFEWLAQFEYEYLSEIEHVRTQEKKQIERDVVPTAVPVIDDPMNAPVPMPDYVKETLVNMTKNKILPSKQIPMTPEQSLAEQYRADFAELQLEQKARPDELFVYFYGMPGRAMNIREYFEFRITGGEKVPQLPRIKQA
jgi:hypothetical protein